MATTVCSSRQSNSDYGSVVSYSSDDELPIQSKQSGSNSPIPAGVCPHCHRIFEQPVMLQCGHSLCLTCCNSLLLSNSHTISRHRPRMGVSSYVAATPSNRSNTPVVPVIHRTPKCPTCGAAPSQAAPIPNLELDNFLRNIKCLQWNMTTTYENSRQKRWEDEGFAINECRIAVVGSSGVGKTCLTRVQYGNEVMFGDHNDDADSYIIDIVDGMELKRSFTEAHGFIIIYSISDRSSFFAATDIYKKLKDGREHNQPMVLIGSKKDQEKRREVSSFDGQQLARTMGCPFLEVSAKRNDCVNETFCELMSMIQRQHRAWQSAVEQTIL